MSKKKITALLFALLLCGSLAACGGQTTETEDGKQDDAVVDTVKDEDTTDGQTSGEEQADKDKADEADKDAADSASQSKPQTGGSATSTGSTTSTSKPQSSGSSSSSTSQSSGSSSSGGSTSTSKPESTPAPQPTPEPGPEPAKPTAAQASGYIGSSASALEAALGSPSSKSYSPSCMGEGEDGVWSYSGFTVYTYRENGVETVEAVA